MDIAPTTQATATGWPSAGLIWPPVADRSVVERAREVALTVAGLLRDPMKVSQIDQSGVDVGWRPASLARGHAGIALLAAQLDILSTR